MSQEELGQSGPSWMKNSTMMNDELLNDDEKFYNDELLNDDEKFYNDENELLNDEGKFYNQKSRNMMVPKNEFRHHNSYFQCNQKNLRDVISHMMQCYVTSDILHSFSHSTTILVVVDISSWGGKSD